MTGGYTEKWRGLHLILSCSENEPVMVNVQGDENVKKIAGIEVGDLILRTYNVDPGPIDDITSGGSPRRQRMDGNCDN